MTVEPAGGRWLVRPRPNAGAAVRLFCFPFAGGGASLFRRWPEALPPSVEVVAVQPPGREARLQELPLRTPDTLIAATANALAPHLRPPFVLFGHSLGALLAFELARSLRRSGLPSPRLLIVSGRGAPHLPIRRQPIHELPDDEFRKELSRLDGTPRAVLEHDDLMRLFTPLLRADFAVSDTYRYREEPPLEVPLVALGGADDPLVEPGELDGWRQHTRAGFESHLFPGGHFFLQSAERELLALLSRRLADLGPAR